MSCFSADKKIHLVNHSKGQDMDKLRLAVVLTGVTGLCQKTASSQKKKRKRSYLQDSFSVHVFKRHLMGSCTTGSKKF